MVFMQNYILDDKTFCFNKLSFEMEREGMQPACLLFAAEICNGEFHSILITVIRVQV